MFTNLFTDEIQTLVTVYSAKCSQGKLQQWLQSSELQKRIQSPRNVPLVTEVKTVCLWASTKPGTWNIPEHPGTFRNIPEHTGAFRSIPEQGKLSQNK